MFKKIQKLSPVIKNFLYPQNERDLIKNYHYLNKLKEYKFTIAGILVLGSIIHYTYKRTKLDPNINFELTQLVIF
jgi:hypothetical protein